MDYKFKIGDRVKIIDGSKINRYTGGWCADMHKYCGSIAAVIERGTTADGRKYYSLVSNGDNDNVKTALMFDERGLEMVNEERKIVITTDGTTTRAALYDGHKLIREAKAMCSKNDTFDFEAGAKIAFERLTAKPKKELKPLNTKIFVLDGANTSLRTAHIYEVVNGKIRIPNINGWWLVPINGTLYNMDDVVNYLTPVSSRTNDYDSAGMMLNEFSSRKVTVMEVKEY